VRCDDGTLEVEGKGVCVHDGGRWTMMERWCCFSRVAPRRTDESVGATTAGVDAQGVVVGTGSGRHGERWKRALPWLGFGADGVFENGANHAST